MQPTEPRQARLDAIAREIESDSSPVGIDAKKTHVLIIDALEQIQERLDRLERRVHALAGGGPSAHRPGDTSHGS